MSSFLPGLSYLRSLVVNHLMKGGLEITKTLKECVGVVGISDLFIMLG